MQNLIKNNFKTLRLHIEPKHVTIFLVFIGIILRLAVYGTKQVLQYDEITRTEYVHEFSYYEILESRHKISIPVHDPYLFLLIQKFLVDMFGRDLYAIRLFPFLCGVLSVWLFAKLKDWLAPSWGGMLALFLFACSPQLIIYSATNNTYSSDALTVLLLCLLFKKMITTPLNLSHGIAYCLAGLAAIYFSLSSVFVLGAIGITFIINEIINKNRQKILVALVICLVWLLNFMFYYFHVLRYFSTAKIVVDCWWPHMMPQQEGVIAACRWTGQRMYAMFYSPASIQPMVGLFCFVIGIIALARKNLIHFLVLFLPFVLTLLASGLHKYPFADRVIIFLLPAVYLLVGIGWHFFYSRERAVAYPMISCVLLATLLISPSQQVKGYLSNILKPQDIREAVAYAKKHYQEGDIIYIFHDAVYYFEYFKDSFGLRPDMYITRRKRDHMKFVSDFDRLRNYKRVWLIFYKGGSPDVNFIIGYLTQIGEKKDGFHSMWTRCWLYEITKVK